MWDHVSGFLAGAGMLLCAVRGWYMYAARYMWMGNICCSVFCVGGVPMLLCVRC